jgi:hypothetical protein
MRNVRASYSHGTNPEEKERDGQKLKGQDPHSKHVGDQLETEASVRIRHGTLSAHTKEIP